MVEDSPPEPSRKSGQVIEYSAKRKIENANGVSNQSYKACTGIVFEDSSKESTLTDSTRSCTTKKFMYQLTNSMNKWSRTGSGGSRNTKTGSLRIFNGWWVVDWSSQKSKSKSKFLSVEEGF
ncbi:hypothetical protein BELL_0080g00040 [Botrytis elliptica]|uniref:Uncharacterized protein n=1 Tax=Botrytis elliptica TaxID=278938 RepID=A0A4Z1JWP0_9HELO|nr:hypothetical protein BELL_0080g00040 [Botrytis elliptica]